MRYDLNAPTEMENITLEEPSMSPCPKDTGGGGGYGGSLCTGFDASGKMSMFTVAVPLVTVKCAIMLHTRAFVSLLHAGSTADGCGATLERCFRFQCSSKNTPVAEGRCH